MALVQVGCAGWSLPRQHAALFPAQGSQLERYAARLGAVEINSSFYRPHRPQTYARWAEAVPGHFRFAVKLPKAITHEARLRQVDAPLHRFLSEVAALGTRLGPLLVQLPPSLAFEAGVARDFWGLLRARFDGDVVCEPRHASWFEPEASQLLVDALVARVAADPPVPAGAGEPGGWPGLVYQRLHGSPRRYYSAYGAARIEALAARLRAASARVPVWCIFDNTALGEATADALALQERLARA